MFLLILFAQFAFATDECDAKLPEVVLAFCQASLMLDVQAMKKSLPAEISVVISKYNGPDCKPLIRTVAFKSEDKEIENILKVFASTIKTDLNDELENPKFGKMGTGRYGTLMIGDCVHETSVSFNSQTAVIESIHMDEIN